MALGRNGAIGAALAGLAVLAGCSSDKGASLQVLQSSLWNRLTTTQAEIRANQAASNAAVVAQPEALRNFESPILLISIDSVNLVGVIGPLVDNGRESVWYSADDTSLAFRDGMIVRSVGLIEDLESASVPDVRRVRGSAVRDHYYRDGDEVIRRKRFYCEITDKGPATARVLDRNYPTRLIEEACDSEEISFTNAYYMGNVGEFRLSRQWLGPEIGYVAVQKVQD